MNVFLNGSDTSELIKEGKGHESLYHTRNLARILE
jgi:hypothetical protein